MTFNFYWNWCILSETKISELTNHLNCLEHYDDLVWLVFIFDRNILILLNPFERFERSERVERERSEVRARSAPRRSREVLVAVRRERTLRARARRSRESAVLGDFAHFVRSSSSLERNVLAKRANQSINK